MGNVQAAAQLIILEPGKCGLFTLLALPCVFTPELLIPALVCHIPPINGAMLMSFVFCCLKEY